MKYAIESGPLRMSGRRNPVISYMIDVSLSKRREPVAKLDPSTALTYAVRLVDARIAPFTMDSFGVAGCKYTVMSTSDAV
jgi:hypothetical protein